ncbi:hypothetical protein RV01_GL001227 [Enterococcus dispar]|nr:hypothetical protein RV01_GL001227 [Enterococcus dispar]
MMSKYAQELLRERIVYVNTPDSDGQPFRIRKVSPSMGILTVEAPHIFYDLSDNLIEDIFIVNSDGQNAGNKILSGTQYPHNFTFYSNIDTFTNCRIVRYNPVEALLDSSKDNVFVNRWGGEINRDGFRIIVNKDRGSDNGVEITNKKNLVGYEAVLDDENVITRIMPTGYDGIMLPEKYVDSPRINEYIHPKIAVINYSDIKIGDGEDEVTEEEAYRLLREAATNEFSVNKVDEPTANYKVNFVDLSKTTDYKDFKALEKIEPWDWVTVHHHEDNLHLKAQMISYKWDPINKSYSEIELGTVIPTASGNFVKTNKVNDQLEEIRDIANSAVQSANGKNVNYYGSQTPSDPKKGDLWYKPNGDETELWQYQEIDGELDWKMIASTANLTQVKADVENAIKAAEDAKQDAADAYTNAVTEAERQVQEQSDAFDEKMVQQKTELTSDIDESKQKADEAVAKAAEAAQKADNSVEVANQAKGDAASAVTSANQAKTDANQAVIDAANALAGIDGLKKDVAVEITRIDGELTSKVSQTVYDQLKGTVESQGTLISQNTSAINLKANQSTVDTLNGRVTRTEGSLSILSGQVSLKANQTEVDTISGKVNANSAELSVQADKIAGLVTKTDGQSTQIANLELQAGQFNLTLSSVQQEVAGIEVGGRNYAINSKQFRNGLNASGILSSVESDGTLTIITNAGNGNWLTNILQSFSETRLNINDSFNENDPITVSLWLKALGEKQSSPTVYMSDSMTYRNAVNHSNNMPTDNYYRYDYIVPKFSKTDAKGFRLFLGFSSAIGKYSLLSIAIRKATKGSDWSPAPEDMATVTALTSVQATVDGLVTTVATKANQSQVTQLADQITSVVSDVEGINSANNLLGGYTFSNNKDVDLTTGEVKSGTRTIVNEYVPVTPNTQYTFSRPEKIKNLGFRGYQSDKKYIGVVTNTSPGEKQTTFVTPVNCYFIKFIDESNKLTKGYFLQVRSATQSQITQLSDQINLRVTQSQVDASILSNSQIKDTRNDNQPPSWYYSNYPKQTAKEFKTSIAIGLNAGSYAYLETAVRWNNTSGGVLTQTAQANNGTYQRKSIGETGWTDWAKIADSSNVVSQINISTEGILIQGKKIQLDGDVTITAAWINKLYADTAFISNLETKTINAVKANITSIITSSLAANTITSTHIKADNAMIDKLFATTALIEQLTSKQAFINNIKAIEISADKITGGTINGATVNVINLNASSITTGIIRGANLSINLGTGEVLFTKGSIRNADGTFVMNIITGVVSSRGEVLSPNDTGEKLPTGFDLMNGRLDFLNGTFGETSVNYGGILTDTHFGQASTGSNTWTLSGTFGNAPSLILHNGDSNASVWQSWKKNVAVGTKVFKELQNPTTSNLIRDGLGTAGVNNQNIIGGAIGLAMNSNSSISPAGYGQTTAVIQARNGITLSSGFGYTHRYGTTTSTRTSVAAIQLGTKENGTTTSDYTKQAAASIVMTGYLIQLKAYEFRVDSVNANINGKLSAWQAAITGMTSKSGSANIIADTSGNLFRVSSARKYKSDIQVATDVINHAKKVLQINPASWWDKEELLNGTAKNRYYGFIADEFHDLGLNEVVVYSETGEVDSLAYDRLTMYHNVILTEHEKEIVELKRRILELEEKINVA